MKQLSLPSNATLKSAVADYSFIVVPGHFFKALSYVLFSRSF